jgi:hypothetical protein
MNDVFHNLHSIVCVSDQIEIQHSDSLTHSLPRSLDHDDRFRVVCGLRFFQVSCRSMTDWRPIDVLSTKSSGNRFTIEMSFNKYFHSIVWWSLRGLPKQHAKSEHWLNWSFVNLFWVWTTKSIIARVWMSESEPCIRSELRQEQLNTD